MASNLDHIKICSTLLTMLRQINSIFIFALVGELLCLFTLQMAYIGAICGVITHFIFKRNTVAAAIVANNEAWREQVEHLKNLNK